MNEKHGIVRQLLVTGFIGLLLMVGCSGGGGGGTNGTGVDPIEVEINTEIEVFLAGINANKLDQAMSEVDTNLQYSRLGAAGGTYLGYNDFKAHLSAFLAGAASVTVTLEDRGIISDGESAAKARGKLKYSYRDRNGVMQSSSEDCEIYWIRVSRWGMNRLSGFSLAGLAFPPAP